MSEQTIKVDPEENLDVRFQLPDGNSLVIQYREETGALDVCFKETVHAEVSCIVDKADDEVSIPELFQVMTVVAKRREADLDLA